jgi:phosphoglucosamine mutase
LSSRKHFGTDGIRGAVGRSPITPDFMLRLGHAVGRVLRRESERPSVVIGKDTRLSGYMIESALEAGFASAGVNVLLSGPLPTPGVAYLTRALRQDLGVVISASHNPYHDNGVKFFSASGEKLPDAWELAVEQSLDEPAQWVDSAGLGRARRIDDAAGRYTEFCKSTFPNALSLRGMKLVVDAAHGAAYHVAPDVFHELGAQVHTIGCKPDGMNINDGVGATAPQALVEAVRAQGADYGVALDGDADRLQMVDASGRLFNGDELLYLIVRERTRHRHVAGTVGTLMSNFGLEQAFQRLGVNFARAKVGDRYVLEMMRQRGWLYGGESSGHLLCLDCHTTGDGTISALQVLGAVRRSGKTLAELTDDLVMYPQRLINVKVAKGFDWQGHAALREATVQVERELGTDGRVLIRPSGTEPLLRVMVEARNDDTADRLARRLAESVAA